MKIKLLKNIRHDVVNKYSIVYTKENDGTYKWRIQTSPKTYLAYYEYDNKEDAEKDLIHFWHEEAEKYLWRHRNERKDKRKHYIW